MAAILITECGCGAWLQVYVPKRTAFAWVGSTPDELSEWAAIDEREQNDDQVETLRQWCDCHGRVFVDYRDGDACPDCGQDLDVQSRVIGLLTTEWADFQRPFVDVEFQPNGSVNIREFVCSFYLVDSTGGRYALN